MVVKVIFRAYLAEDVGTESIEVEHSGSLRDLLIKIAEKLGDKAEAVFSDGKPRRGTLIVVNGRLVRNLDVEVGEGDVVEILPSGTGG